VRVDTERGLVLDEVADGIGVAVMHFGFGGDGDELVGLSEEGGALEGEEAGVRDDDCGGGVENPESVEFLGRVCDWDKR